MKRVHTSLFLVLAIAIFGNHAIAQNSQQIFGKNRVQNKVFNWEFLSTQNFDIYFYYGGRESAIYASKYAELEVQNLFNLIGYNSYKKIKILVYNTPGDLLQSNITSEEPNPMTGGVTNFVKAKMEVAFAGNHVQFRNEIKKGIAKYLVNELMYGGSIKEIFQNAYFLSLPNWYISGIAQYAGYGWSRQMDNHLRSLILSNALKNPNSYEDENAELIGQSIWNFIAQKYGSSNISSILQITQVVRSPQNAIEAVLGISYNQFLEDWEKYYEDQTKIVDDKLEEADAKLKVKKRNKLFKSYERLAMSTTGEYLGYIQHHKGRYKVKLYFHGSKKTKTIHRGGRRVIDQQPDKSMPLLSCGGDRIGIVHHKKNGIFLSTYDSRGKLDKRIPLAGLENVLDFDYSDDGNAIVFSGQVNGQSDLYYYNIKDNTYRQLTMDFNDDLQPRFLKNSNAVIFSSNRAEDTVIFTRVYPEKKKVLEII